MCARELFRARLLCRVTSSCYSRSSIYSSARLGGRDPCAPYSLLTASMHIFWPRPGSWAPTDGGGAVWAGETRADIGRPEDAKKVFANSPAVPPRGGGVAPGFSASPCRRGIVPSGNGRSCLRLEGGDLSHPGT